MSENENEVLAETSITLQNKDAALVVREGSGSFEMHLPKMDDPNEIVPNHVILLVAVALRLKDEEFTKELMDWFELQVKKENATIEKEEAEKVVN